MPIDDLFADGKKPNLVFIITDQERALMHWPEDFAEKNLPALSRLMNSGLSFHQAFTNACCCSPSRATLLTSRYPSDHGVTTTGSPQPLFSLPKDLINLATVLNKAGYRCEWRGKWHLGGDGPEEYGFNGWVPPDAGNYLSLNDTLGAGIPDNDGRFLEEIMEFLDSQSGGNNDQPFCLVASFVNPHDVYVAQYEADGTLGYTPEDFNRVSVPLPSNAFEDLEFNNKPRGQLIMSMPYVPFENSPQDYVNFYAYLHTIVDDQIMQLLKKLDEKKLTDDTLIIRFADHGEQNLNHSLVEKLVNAYEESIRIPFIFSNPIVYPEGQTTDALASSMDLVPTVAHLLGVADEYSDKFVGNDISPIFRDPSQSVQDSIHFVYDDIPCSRSPSIIRCIRTSRYKYAVYFTNDGGDADWELYDLKHDPNENDNRAGWEKYAEVQSYLDNKLQELMKEKNTMPTNFTWPPKATENSRGTQKSQEEPLTRTTELDTSSARRKCFVAGA